MAHLSIVVLGQHAHWDAAKVGGDLQDEIPVALRLQISSNVSIHVNFDTYTLTMVEVVAVRLGLKKQFNNNDTSTCTLANPSSMSLFYKPCMCGPYKWEMWLAARTGFILGKSISRLQLE